MIAQLIVIALGMISLGGHISRHGEVQKERKYNGWSTLISMAILWTILYYGGFWDGLYTR
jgi:hypothetical protein